MPTTFFTSTTRKRVDFPLIHSLARRAGIKGQFPHPAVGKDREVKVPMLVVCSQCHGNGSASGKPPETCSDCGGSGQVSRVGRQEGGYFSISSACPTCGGTGQSNEPDCRLCHGAGRVQKLQRINVSIPAGIDDGQTLRLRGQGEAGQGGGPKGDLLIEIRITPHASFKRKGNNIHSDVNVPVATALLGGKVDVATIHGRVTLSIPAGTSSDRTLRIRGQGMKAGDSTADHLVRVVIAIPKDLSDEAKAAVEEHLAHR